MKSNLPYRVWAAAAVILQAWKLSAPVNETSRVQQPSFSVATNSNGRYPPAPALGPTLLPGAGRNHSIQCYLEGPGSRKAGSRYAPRDCS